MRFRDDKPNGNHRSVVDKIIQSISEGVEKDKVCRSGRFGMAGQRSRSLKAPGAIEHHPNRVENTAWTTSGCGPHISTPPRERPTTTNKSTARSPARVPLRTPSSLAIQ